MDQTAAAPTPIEMMVCDSSQIARIGHCPETNTLAVEFKRGGIWHYFGVPVETFEEMKAADSVGSYFHHNIKGTYAHGRQDAPKPEEGAASE